MLGAIELGGTKVCCGVSNGDHKFIEEVRIETRDPNSTLEKIIDFFEQSQKRHGDLVGLGVASFGPIDIDERSPSHGSILQTPKIGWANFALLQTLKSSFQIPIAITTDVNAAMLAEHQLGAARGVDNAVYVTVGTGIGAGIIANGQLVQGFLHPEVGHMRIPTDGVRGSCSFHGNCLEGLASGPAIAVRTGQAADKLSSEHPIWDDVASNLADMCNNLITTLATQRIVLGGGVMSQPFLLNKIKQNLKQKLNGYLPLKEGDKAFDQLIVGAEVQGASGLVGALLLAQRTRK